MFGESSLLVVAPSCRRPSMRNLPGNGQLPAFRHSNIPLGRSFGASFGTSFATSFATNSCTSDWLLGTGTRLCEGSLTCWSRSCQRSREVSSVSLGRRKVQLSLVVERQCQTAVGI